MRLVMIYDRVRESAILILGEKLAMEAAREVPPTRRRTLLVMDLDRVDRGQATSIARLVVVVVRD